MSSPSQPTDAATTSQPIVLDKKKSIILGIVGLAFIALIFWKVIPQIGSYSQAIDAIKSMSGLALTLIIMSVVLYLGVYGLPFVAAVPGLAYWKGQQLNQAAFAISNGVPGGGAVGLAVQYGMLASYQVPGTAATAAITTVGLWSAFVTLGLPVLGVLALIASGKPSGAYVWAGVIGLIILIVAVVLLLLLIRSEGVARWLGRLINAISRPLSKFIKPLKDKDFVPAVVGFRTVIYDLVVHRWAAITASQAGVILTQFFILYTAVRGVEGWNTDGSAFLIVFAAFAISQLGMMVPITPGGLGTVDAVMIGLLVNFGTDKGAATAAVLVWRAASYVPQISIGILALVSWSRRANRMLAGVKPKAS